MKERSEVVGVSYGRPSLTDLTWVREIPFFIAIGILSLCSPCDNDAFVASDVTFVIRLRNGRCLNRRRLQVTHLWSPRRDYSVVMLSGVVMTIGGRRKVTMRLRANSDTAVSSISAETGKPLHAQAA